jgi:hypothetical protein
LEEYLGGTIDFRFELGEFDMPLGSPKITNGLPQEHLGHLKSTNKLSGASNPSSLQIHSNFTDIA